MSLLVLACGLTVAATVLPLFTIFLPALDKSLPPEAAAQIGAWGTTIMTGDLLYGPPLGISLWIAAGSVLATIVLVVLRHRGTAVGAARPAILGCTGLAIGVGLTVGTHGFVPSDWDPETGVSPSWGMAALIAAVCCLLLLSVLEVRYRAPVLHPARPDEPQPQHGVSITVLPSDDPRH